MTKKDFLIVCGLLVLVTLAVALGFLHFTANFGLGMAN